MTALVAAFVLEKCLLLWIGFPIIHPNTVMLYPLTATVLVLLLKHPLERGESLAASARTCANFIYYVHMLFILIAGRIFPKLFHTPLEGVGMLVLTVALLTAVGLVLHRIKWIRKWLN